MQLDDLASAQFWSAHSASDRSELPFVVVLPSGRAKLATSGHLALASDALFTHEIVLNVGRIAREDGIERLVVRSMLDIDFYDAFRDRDSRVLNANLLLVGTADINLVSKLLLEECRSHETLQVGFMNPYEDCVIVGGKGKRYTAMSEPNVGVLALYHVPWSDPGPRCALFCGGPMASGTLAASRLLLDFLEGAATGNNRHRPDVPVRIVTAPKRLYRHADLLDVEESVPKHDLRNIVETSLTILE